jgi:aconitate hydratase
VAYALAGTMTVDLNNEPLGQDKDGNDVFMKDLWPSNKEISDVILEHLSSEMFKKRYSNVFEGDQRWKDINTPEGVLYQWDDSSTYIRKPTFFENINEVQDENFKVEKASILGLFGDSVTTDHISPAGNIAKNSPAGVYLSAQGVKPIDFNSYGSRRGNHEVMMRGTFANIRIKNEMLPGVEGGFTKHIPSQKQMAIYDAAMEYKKENTPLVVFGGKEYGTGSSRDWAAKGTTLLGVQAVIVESFERIHRSNLIGMGVLPLTFQNGEGWKEFKMTGSEQVDLELVGKLEPKMKIKMTVHFEDGTSKDTELLSRLDTIDELNYFKSGGILHYVLRNLNK